MAGYANMDIYAIRILIHDHIIPTAVSGVTLAVSLTVSLAVSCVSYFPSSLSVFKRFLWPEAISQRVFISRGRTRARWKALVKAHTIVQ